MSLHRTVRELGKRTRSGGESARELKLETQVLHADTRLNVRRLILSVCVCDTEMVLVVKEEGCGRWQWPLKAWKVEERRGEEGG